MADTQVQINGQAFDCADPLLEHASNGRIIDIERSEDSWIEPFTLKLFIRLDQGVDHLFGDGLGRIGLGKNHAEGGTVGSFLHPSGGINLLFHGLLHGLGIGDLVINFFLSLFIVGNHGFRRAFVFADEQAVDLVNKFFQYHYPGGARLEGLVVIRHAHLEPQGGRLAVFGRCGYPDESAVFNGLTGFDIDSHYSFEHLDHLADIFVVPCDPHGAAPKGFHHFLHLSGVLGVNRKIFGVL